jgi:hypothetical protein
MYTVRASDDEIDRALGIPKRANTQGEASASGGGGKGMPQMPNAPDEGSACGGGGKGTSQNSKAPDVGSASGGGSTDTSQKRSGREGESSDSGKAPQKKAKTDGKEPAGADENADDKSNEERLQDLSFDFFKSIYEDPDNLNKKWTFKTLDVLKSTADKCKKVPVRITYAIRIVDHFQKCEWVENGFACDIVCEALRNIFSSKIEDAELESVMTQAIGLMQHRA